jgi:molybdopterin converting factor small subunit
MTIKVRIPTPLMKLTENQSEVSAEGETIFDIINNLESQFNGIKDRICEENGAPRRFINIYVNEEDIRFLEGEKTAVKDGDEISIIKLPFHLQWLG